MQLVFLKLYLLGCNKTKFLLNIPVRVFSTYHSSELHPFGYMNLSTYAVHRLGLPDVIKIVYAQASL